MLDFLALLKAISASQVTASFCSATAGESELSVKLKPREYIRQAREGKVEDLEAAENDDQYHRSFLKNSV